MRQHARLAGSFKQFDGFGDRPVRVLEPIGYEQRESQSG